MLFSIVVPVYNVEKYLAECMSSIIKQAKKCTLGIEIILVDDGSTDDSGKMCDEYKSEYPDLIKVIHKKNEGLLMARRSGYKILSGDYIINCDSDDKLADGCLDRLSEIIEKGNPDVIIYNAYLWDEKENSKLLFSDIFSEEKFTPIDKSEVLNDFLCSHRTVSMWCKVYKSELINKDNDYSDFRHISMGEDTLQTIEIYEKAKKFFYINEPLYYYRQGTGMTTKFKDNYFYQFKDVCNQIDKVMRSWSIEKFEIKFANKVFNILGRSITQGRKDRNYSYKKEKDYLTRLRTDSLIKMNEKNFLKVRSDLQMSYKILCSLLLKEKYFTIYILIKIMNIVD